MIADWLGIHERPEGFRLTEDQTHPYRQGLRFLGAAGGGCARSLKFHDSSPFGNHGTLTNMDPVTDWAWDPILNRFTLDFDNGTTQLVDTGRTLLLEQQCSWAFWIKAKLTSNNINWIMSQRTTYATMDWQILNTATHDLYLYCALTPVLDVDPKVTLGNNIWEHYLITKNGSTHRCYRNGEFVKEDVTAVSLPAGTDTFVVGKALQSDAALYSADATLSDPAIWNRTLSDGEAQQLGDRSNVMLSGLLLPPQRRLWKVGGGAAAKYWLWARQQQSQVIGGGVG